MQPNEPTPPNPLPQPGPGGAPVPPGRVVPPLGNRAPVPEYSGLPAPVSGPPQPVKFKPPRRGRIKLFLIVLLLVLLLGAASAAAYFTVLVPNRPELLWHAAMDNTAKGYDKMLSQTQPQDVKGMDMNGTFSLDGPTKTDGSVETAWYEGTGSATLDVGLGATRAKLEGRMFKSASTTPDIYLNVSGIKGLGTQFGRPAADPVLDKLDNQWILVDHTAIDNLQKQLQAPGAAATTPQLTPEEANEIARKAGDALKMYVFTDDPTKAVITVKQNIGKEQHEGRVTYHYKAGVNKQNLKDFAAMLKDKLDETKLKQLLGGKSVAEAMNYEQMLKQIDKIDTNTAQADVWIDTQTKLFQTVRFETKPGSADDYLEVSMPYTGGDDVPFNLKTAGKDSKTQDEATIKLTLNTKTNQYKVGVSFMEKTEKATTSFKLDLAAKPRTTAVNIDKPQNVKTLAETMSMLGIPPQALQSLGGSTGTGAMPSLPLLQQ